VIEQAPSILKERFRYDIDGGIDTWHILRGDVVYGDCDDFTITLLWECASRSILRMWWWILTFKAVPWLVEGPVGDRHVALWLRGHGWACNIFPYWREEQDMPKILPFILPIVILKLLLGKVMR